MLSVPRFYATGEDLFDLISSSLKTLQSQSGQGIAAFLHKK
jgi:hypothetical protein